MAPTVYFADISPVEIGSDSDGEEQMPTVIVGYGVRDLRSRRRLPMVQHGRANHPHPRRPMAEASRHPTSRDHKDQTLPISIDSNSPCSIRSSTSLNVKTTRSCPSRLLLLKRRKGLLDITLRTVALIRRNQQLQLRLTALQAETRAFVRSVMSNPENRGLQLAKVGSFDERENTPDNRDDEDSTDQ